jgi:hypothetical protein
LLVGFRDAAEDVEQARRLDPDREAASANDLEVARDDVARLVCRRLRRG